MFALLQSSETFIVFSCSYKSIPTTAQKITETIVTLTQNTKHTFHSKVRFIVKVSAYPRLCGGRLYPSFGAHNILTTVATLNTRANVSRSLSIVL